jgi:hypothetical protein
MNMRFFLLNKCIVRYAGGKLTRDFVCSPCALYFALLR